MQKNRQVGATDAPSHLVEAHHLVEVTVAEHDCLERAGWDAEPVEVADQPVRGDTGVEEHASWPAGDRSFHLRRESVLSTNKVQALSTDGHAVRDDWQRSAN